MSNDDDVSVSQSFEESILTSSVATDRWQKFVTWYFNLLTNLAIVAALAVYANKTKNGPLWFVAGLSELALYLYVLSYIPVVIRQMTAFHRFTSYWAKLIELMVVMVVMILLTYFSYEVISTVVLGIANGINGK